MIAVDTNVLVRFLVRDDERQAAKVYRHFITAERQRERFFVPALVVLELIWVLQSAYDRSRAEVLSAVEDMRQMPVFEFEKDDAIERWLNDGRKSKVNLADILIAHMACASGCESGITFDKRAARLPFFSLLQ